MVAYGAGILDKVGQWSSADYRHSEFEFEWRFYAQSASKAIFRARTYSHITYSVRDDDYLMNETRRKPTTGRQFPSHRHSEDGAQSTGARNTETQQIVNIPPSITTIGRQKPFGVEEPSDNLLTSLSCRVVVGFWWHSGIVDSD